MSEAPRDLLAEAAARWGTPLYVTDLDAAAHRLGTWRAAFPGALIAYAVKANSDPHLLHRLLADGAGCEVVSGLELALALRAGAPPRRIVMNGVGRTDDELRAGLEAGALVNAESIDDLDAVLDLAAALPVGDRPHPLIGLRLNPGLDTQTHPHLGTGAADSKFGVSASDLPRVLGRFRAARRQLASLGAHIGSDIGSADAFAPLARVLADAAAEATEADLSPARIDLGGGLRSADPETLTALADAVRPSFPDASRLTWEPGRSVVAQAGWLLTSVLRIQERKSLAWLVADAGMTELIRPMLYGAQHPVSLIAPGARRLEIGEGVAVHLAGPVCEAGDTLARHLERQLSRGELAAAGRGAVLAIGEAGAYGAAMASNYNGRLRPAEAVIERGELRLSRRRETLDDLLARG